MVTEIPFAKASGAGNDFVIINNYGGWLHSDQSMLARHLCARHTGIGADGLLILESSKRADFRMMYYNADGSYGGMCGNGGRCIARFASMLGLAGPRMKFEALDHVYDAEIVDDLVRLKMKTPLDYRPAVPVQIGGSRLALSTINTGAPHAVAFLEEIESLDVEKVGSAVRHAEMFAPEGTNANFVHLLGGNSIEIRTYERGVEAETLACGTGSVAAALISSIERGLGFPVRVRVRSGEFLTIDAQIEAKKFRDVFLQGGAQILFSGSVLCDSSSGQVSGYSADQLRRTLVP